MDFCRESILSMEPSWRALLQEELEKPYMKQLSAFLQQERASGKKIYPPEAQVFHSFSYTSLDQVKGVIVGQDPYHGPGQAHGLSFSVPKGIPIPPSLQNIFKELKEDLGVDPPSHGSLVSWARQGVLLLNATLTVRAGEPKSHHGQGWERFTDRVFELLGARPVPMVFMLWGKSAIEKWHQIQSLNPKHLVLTSVHPSPLSAYRGFFGCRHFSQGNAFLEKQGREPIDWKIHL